jgi:hypothetical protein
MERQRTVNRLNLLCAPRWFLRATPCQNFFSPGNLWTGNDFHFDIRKSVFKTLSKLVRVPKIESENQQDTMLDKFYVFQQLDYHSQFSIFFI